MTSGTDVLDALIAGVNIVELDPEDTSVGFVAFRTEMDRATRRQLHAWWKEAGGRRRCLEGVRTPSLVAKACGHTDHHLLVGAVHKHSLDMGFTIEPDLNTPRSRQLWLE
jgi:N4-(beta-N-acetylglucosaminyl)-L-asparaginase